MSQSDNYMLENKISSAVKKKVLSLYDAFESKNIFENPKEKLFKKHKERAALNFKIVVHLNPK